MAVEITEEFVWQSIPPRARDSHKGTFGSVLAVAGSAFYRGAALLAAEGALRAGAGIVTLASVEPVVSAAVVSRAETPGRFSLSKVIMRSESVCDFLMSLAVSSSVADRAMALP